MFGKGERVIRCKNIILILLFSNLLISAYTLGVYLNGGLYNSYTEKQIKKLSYPIPSAKDFVNGVTLDELSPLLINAYKVTIKYDSGNYTFDNDNAADLLPSWYAYIDANNSLNIRINGKIFKNAEARPEHYWKHFSETYNHNLLMFLKYLGEEKDLVIDYILSR